MGEREREGRSETAGSAGSSVPDPRDSQYSLGFGIFRRLPPLSQRCARSLSARSFSRDFSRVFPRFTLALSPPPPPSRRPSGVRTCALDALATKLYGIAHPLSARVGRGEGEFPAINFRVRGRMARTISYQQLPRCRRRAFANDGMEGGEGGTGKR